MQAIKQVRCKHLIQKAKNVEIKQSKRINDAKNKNCACKRNGGKIS